jgi:hypothetical protein
VRPANSTPKTPRLGWEGNPGMPGEPAEFTDGESAEDDDRDDTESGGIVTKLRAQSQRDDDVITGDQDPQCLRSNHYHQSGSFAVTFIEHGSKRH